MGYLTVVGMRWGRRAGLTTVAGITCGLLIYLLLTVAGLGSVILRLPWLYAALRWTGVGYLAWLGWESWRGGGGTSPSRAAEAAEPGRLFLRGLLANLLNPKAAVFYIALLPGFTDPAWGNPASQALALGTIHIALSVAVHSTIVFLSGGAGRGIARLTGGAGLPWLNRTFAVGLLLIAAWLAWETASKP